MAEDGRQADEEDERLHGQEVLRREAEQRANRIRIRRQQQIKKAAAKRLAKRKRVFKVAGAWIGILIAGFLVAAWFSLDLASKFN